MDIYSCDSARVHRDASLERELLGNRERERERELLDLNDLSLERDSDEVTKEPKRNTGVKFSSKLFSRVIKVHNFRKMVRKDDLRMTWFNDNRFVIDLPRLGLSIDQDLNSRVNPFYVIYRIPRLTCLLPV